MVNEKLQLLKAIGRRISRYRKVAGLSQTELQDRVWPEKNNVHTRIANYEQGRSPATIYDLSLVAKALDVNLLQLITDAEVDVLKSSTPIITWGHAMMQKSPVYRLKLTDDLADDFRAGNILEIDTTIPYGPGDIVLMADDNAQPIVAQVTGTKNKLSIKWLNKKRRLMHEENFPSHILGVVISRTTFLK